MDVFDLHATIRLDTKEYEQAVKGASADGQQLAKSWSGSGQKISAAFSVLGKAAVAGAGAATAAVGVLTKSSLDAYSSFEQLTGGVETLFKTSADTVMEYADNAYKTAGMSANQYMETVTGFSATLLQGLAGDTEAAAEYADLAITDMADNANKMGTAMQSIQYAYQGFAKDNYTMLDNLKLGYGGTQAEMARLINDSGVLGETMQVTADTVNQVSFDKIIEAIHVVQTQLGITGTTAAEAATTIEGSVNSMKAAWENLLVGIADENADVSALFDAFASSAETALGNLIPRITRIFEGLGDAIAAAAPAIAAQVPPLIDSLLPAFLSAVTSLAGNVAAQIPSILLSIVNAVGSVVDDIGNELSSSIPALSVIFENLETVVAATTATFVAYKAAITISSVVDNLTKALNGATVAQAALNAVMKANPIVIVVSLIAGLVTAVVTLWNTSEDFRNAVTNIINDIKGKIAYIYTYISTTFSNIGKIFGNLVDAVKRAFTGQEVTFEDFFKGVVDAGTAASNAAAQASGEAARQAAFEWQAAEDAIVTNAEKNAFIVANNTKSAANDVVQTIDVASESAASSV